MTGLLRERTFRRYWAAQTVSFTGDAVTGIALPLLAVGVTAADPVQMGLLAAAQWLPSLLFGVPAGVWADRRARRRRVMVATDLGRAALLLSVPVVWLAGATSVEYLVAVAFGVGLLGVLFSVCDAGLLPAIVPPARYVDANALVGGSRAMAHVVGPGAGGALVQALSAPVAMIADACSYLVSAVLLARIDPVEPSGVQPGPGAVRAGLRHLRTSPVLRPALLATATVNLAAAAIAALVVLYASTTLGLAPWQIGLALGVGAVGGLLGAALAGPVARRIGVGPTFAVGCLVYPASMLLIPLVDGGDPTAAVVVLAVSEFLQGVGVMGLDVAGAAILTGTVPAALRSRVHGAYQTVNFGTRPVGALVGGVVAAAVGVRPTLWIAAAIGITAVLWLLRRPILELRDLPQPHRAGRPEGVA